MTRQEIIARALDLKDQNKSETDIAQQLGVAVHELRAMRAEDRTQRREVVAGRATQMKETGYSNVEIADALGLAESSVRAILEPS